MAQTIRYRVGLSQKTGKMITGLAHLIQSLEIIWQTRLGELVMDLRFGSDLRRFLSEDISPELALDIYQELIVSAERYEPEYRGNQFQLLKIGEAGVLGLKHSGIYYPEGRFGNYDIARNFDATPNVLGRMR